MTASGGPESIHQLAQIINELGVRAEIIYGGSSFEIVKSKGVQLLYEPPTVNPTRGEYARYCPIPAHSTVLTEQTLVILPELFPAMHAMFAPAQTAYWWLSWDNAFFNGSPLNEPVFRSKFFARRDLLHLAQTFRTHILLRDRGAAHILDLVSYTDPRFTIAMPIKPNDNFGVAYNPRKSSELPKRFFEQNPDIPGCPIAGMSKEQLRDILSRTMIYVEFGNNPGNDRLPREAACVGCIVLAKRAGGSVYFEDMPLDDSFKFTEEQVKSGKLAETIRAISRDPVPYFNAQSYYRRHLFLDKAQMRLQARRLLGL